MIDLHCHLLPGVDDGPRDMRDALSMARLQLAAGVATVTATPHVSWDMPTEPEHAAQVLAALREALEAEQIALEVLPGAEIDVHQAASLADETLRELTLGGGRYLLLEAPLRQPLPLEPVACDLIERGFGVLIAHPERSPTLQRDPSILQRIVAAGALTQVTAGSLVGRFGRTVQRFTELLLDDGLVHSVASDAHDPLRRPPGIVDAICEAGLGDLAELLAQQVPAAILADEAIPAVPRRTRTGSPARGLRTLLRY